MDFAPFGIELFQGIGSYTISNGIVSRTKSLSPGTYTFLIIDYISDGICCSYGNGSYDVSLNGSSVGGGSSFRNFATVTFTVPGAPNVATDPPNVSASVVVVHGDAALATGWILVGAMGTILVQEADTVATNGERVSVSALVSPGIYYFIIVNYSAYGLCCGGSYTVSIGTATTSGSTFTTHQSAVLTMR
jgi:hypothetical protein